MKNYYVYIITNKYNSVLYIGVTNDLERRMSEHKAGLTKGFSRKYNLDKLVWYSHTDDTSRAIEEEKRLKAWRRQWKMELIEKDNPKWEDLSQGWF